MADALAELNTLSPAAAATDDDLWANMAQAFTVSPNILNLNNGGVSPQPKVVQDAVDRYYHLSNEAPTYYMWQILDRGREPLRRKLANLAGVSADEIAKTSRAIDTANATVGAGPVDSTKVMGSLPDFQAGVVPTVTPPPSAPIAAPPSPDGLDFFKSANAFKGTPTAQDLIAGRVANAANTGIAGILGGARSLFTSPQSREVFGEALGGGFKSPLAQNLSKQATFMGIANALTPEYEMPSGGAEEEGASVYIPGAVNPMYGYGGQYSYFMPGWPRSGS